MSMVTGVGVVLCLVFGLAGLGQKSFEKDVIETSAGNLQITFIGHGTLMFEFGGKVIHVDPVGAQADYMQLPKADLVLVTHEHGDHLDPEALKLLSKEATKIVLTEKCAAEFPGGVVMRNGDVQTVAGIEVEAVPAYNLEGRPFHPKGQGNGYVIRFGDRRVYVAGNTSRFSL